jgi:2-dehydro-3-deoxyphosphogluconate aldolase/(4S)-4-hydroxy-2-oxoglutarate aldolase
MPTGGVDATEESISGWFKAGASCVGMGSKLIRKDLVTAQNYEAIRQNVSQVLAWIRQARKEG